MYYCILPNQLAIFWSDAMARYYLSRLERSLKHVETSFTDSPCMPYMPISWGGLEAQCTHPMSRVWVLRPCLLGLTSTSHIIRKSHPSLERSVRHVGCHVIRHPWNVPSVEGTTPFSVGQSGECPPWTDQFDPSRADEPTFDSGCCSQIGVCFFL